MYRNWPEKQKRVAEMHTHTLIIHLCNPIKACAVKSHCERIATRQDSTHSFRYSEQSLFGDHPVCPPHWRLHGSLRLRGELCILCTDLQADWGPGCNYPFPGHWFSFCPEMPRLIRPHVSDRFHDERWNCSFIAASFFPLPNMWSYSFFPSVLTGALVPAAEKLLHVVRARHDRMFLWTMGCICSAQNIFFGLMFNHPALVESDHMTFPHTLPFW